LIGGIDVYRNAPDDPVEFNKDWYAVLWNNSDDQHLLIRGPHRPEIDHWLNDIPKQVKQISLYGLPASPHDFFL
jgi:hypothetical protein